MGCPYLVLQEDGSHEYMYYCKSCGRTIGHTYDKKTVDDICRSGMYYYEDCYAYKCWGSSPGVPPDAEKTWGNRSDSSPPSSGSSSSVYDRPESSHSTARETDDSSDEWESRGSSYRESSSSDPLPPIGSGPILVWLLVILSPFVFVLAILEGVGYLRHSGVLDRHNYPALEQVSVEKLRAGNIVTFGRYEQDPDKAGYEDIEWIVLEKEDDRILVASRYLLDCQPFNTFDEPTTWESCSLRYWLNTSFYNTAFDSSEKAMIQTVRLDPETVRDHVCNATDNKVFLLSVGEALQYFETDNDRDCLPTDYAKAQGVESKYRFYYASNYWLRTPGTYQNSASVVYPTGEVSSANLAFTSVNNNKVGVRPAMWILFDPAGNDTAPELVWPDEAVDPLPPADDSGYPSDLPEPAAPAAAESEDLVTLAESRLSANYNGNDNSINWDRGAVRDAYRNEYDGYLVFSVSNEKASPPSITLDLGGEDRVLDAWCFVAGWRAARGVMGGHTDAKEEMGLRFYADERQIWDTGALSSLDGAQELHLDLSGAQTLRIELYGVKKSYGNPTRAYLCGAVRDKSAPSALPQRREPERPDRVDLVDLAEQYIASNWSSSGDNSQDCSTDSCKDAKGDRYSGYLVFRIGKRDEPAPWYLLDLGGAYRSLDLTCFVADRYGKSWGTDEQLGLRFYADDRLICDTGLLHGDMDPMALHLDVSGAKTLKIEAYAGDKGIRNSRLFVVDGSLSKD